jgi:hypothetical protein
VTAYVLSRATAGQELLIRSSISLASDVMPRVLCGDVAGAMKELHTVKENGL